MPKYVKGTAGKLIVQDWNVISNYPDQQVLRILTEPQIAALVSLCEFLSWRTRYLNFPGQDVIDAFSAETIYNLTTPLDLCALLEPCLTPIYDALAGLEVTQGEQTTQLDALQQAMNASRAMEKETPPVEETDAIYAGALAVVQYMDRKNRLIYQEAEDSAVDNAAEYTDAVLQYVPNAYALQVAAGAELANTYFQNQVDDYITDYTPFEVPAAFDLYCRLNAAMGQFSVELWGDWLNNVEVIVPANKAAQLYAKYSPLRQTFLNQIAALINGEQSLEQYFSEIAQAYITGSTTPVALPSGYECPDGIAFAVALFDQCGDGAYQTVPFVNGVPFEMEAREIGSSGSYYLAIVLPSGNYEITLNSITGTITPPVDLNQTAYSYFDTLGIQVLVSWNTPATPEDFGTQDTGQGFFAPWCSEQGWNAVLFNEAPFSASFTVSPV